MKTNNDFSKIRVIGKGGLGVKFMSKLLAKIAEQQKQGVTLVYNYDAAVRGGGISADLVLNADESSCPVISHPDITLNLIEQEIQLNSSGDEFNYKDQYDDLRKDENISLNTYSLGLLLNLLKINPDDLALKKVLPNKKQQKNIRAIKLGYQQQSVV